MDLFLDLLLQFDYFVIIMEQFLEEEGIIFD